MNYRHFSEYRHKDYHTPRSMKEAYGWDAPLYVEADNDPEWLAPANYLVALAFALIIFGVWLLV